MPKISVISGPASHDLADRIANHLDVRLVKAELRTFSDGESKIKIAGNVETNCVIVQSTYPPVDTHIMQMLMIAKKCVEDGAQNVSVVIPYLGYARQDRAFLEGEVVSIALVAKLIEAIGIKHVVTVDIHSKHAMSYFGFNIHNISSIPLLANFAISKMQLQKPIVVSPDIGGKDRAKEFARLLNADMIVLNKTRDRNTGEVKINEKISADISGRDTILIDDMISSGSSIIRATQLLREKRAEKVYAMCAHGLLLDDAAAKIKAAGVQDIVSTNSVPSIWAKADLSHIISEAVKFRYALP